MLEPADHSVLRVSQGFAFPEAFLAPTASLPSKKYALSLRLCLAELLDTLISTLYHSYNQILLFSLRPLATYHLLEKQSNKDL